MARRTVCAILGGLLLAGVSWTNAEARSGPISPAATTYPIDQKRTAHDPPTADLMAVSSRGVVPPAGSPPLVLDLLYQDCFPAENTLLANAPANMYSFLDNTYADGDGTNAQMGDSAVVQTTGAPDVHVYLNYRVYPGPFTDVLDVFFTECGNALAPQWARARMDTSENGGGPLSGRFASYHLEGSCGFVAPERVTCPDEINSCPNPANKILPDGLFTPGTTIEYFFSASFGPIGSGDVTVVPDTTGGVYFEVEVLPGYVEVAGAQGTALVAPCLLYVDASNAGAQVPIQDNGLRPYLGTIVDVDGRIHDGWDRYDYLASSSNVAAPLHREPGGDNGCTKLQAFAYRHILYNTGTSFGGLTDWDANLLVWHARDAMCPGEPAMERGLWLSGNWIPGTLDFPGQPNSAELLHDIMGASIAFGGQTWGQVAGDASPCVRLDPAAGRDFPPSGASYSSVQGAGQLIDPLGVAGVEPNQEYVDQDAGETTVGSYASISNDQLIHPSGAWRAVLDTYSLHLLRSTPDGWTGSACTSDLHAITQRTADVLGWLGVTVGCEAEVSCIISTPDLDPPLSAAARTHLFANSPNPFNPRTTIRYELDESATVKLQVFDTAGVLVTTLADGVQEPGRYNVEWDGTTSRGTKVASGVFWVRMSTSRGYSGSTRMVILK